MLVAAAFASPAAQQPAARFETVTIRPGAGGSSEGSILAATPGRLTMTNLPLRSIVSFAYGVRDYQVIGVPDWAATTSYDIAASHPGGATASEEDLRVMVRSLLADRFGLAARTVTRELTTYELVMARKDGEPGPSLLRSDVDCDQEPARLASGGPVCMMLANRIFLNGGARTMSDLATVLERYLKAPVVDRTGLTGGFDMSLQWPSPPGADGPPESATVEEVAALLAALPDQLGLKLERTAKPLAAVVIESVRPPSAD